MYFMKFTLVDTSYWLYRTFQFHFIYSSLFSVNFLGSQLLLLSVLRQTYDA